MSDILLEIQDMPGEIYDIDWQSGLRGYRDDTDCNLFEAVTWVQETHDIPWSEDLVEACQEILNENDWYEDPNSVMSRHHY
ncbi:MAG: hypothetical protein EB168_09730 [Euryarchaeota archaeon]|jgi:hypothetical protein|nr:hypothetical protein [Euryarchaeota archaeon]